MKTRYNAAFGKSEPEKLVGMKRIHKHYPILRNDTFLLTGGDRLIESENRQYSHASRANREGPRPTSPRNQELARREPRDTETTDNTCRKHRTWCRGYGHRPQGLIEERHGPIEQFEVEHPSTTGVLNKIMLTLSPWKFSPPAHAPDHQGKPSGRSDARRMPW